jgi:hypothetical protein
VERRAVVTEVELIVAALAAGAAAGITDTTSAAIRDAYTRLRDGVQRRLADRDERATLALDAGEAGRLGEDLVGSGADRDEQILASARELLAGLDPAGARAGKYSVDLREAKGVMVGDHNTQTNTFA